MYHLLYMKACFNEKVGTFFQGRPMDFVDVDDGNRQWVEDFMTKPMSVPLRLETLESVL